MAHGKGKTAALAVPALTGGAYLGAATTKRFKPRAWALG